MATFEEDKLYIFMTFDPWEPFVGTITASGTRTEMMMTEEDYMVHGYLELVRDWPVGEVYWFVKSPTTRQLIEYLCSADEFVAWFDVWDQFKQCQGDDSSPQEKFKYACVSLWDSKRQ